MNLEILSQLVNNAGLLLSVSILNQVGHLIIHRRSKYSDVIDGLILGVIAITVMTNPMTFVEGLVFDTRSILLSVSALYLGAIPAIIAAIMAALFRIYQGGVGALAGVLVIGSVTAFGLIWRTFSSPNKIRRKAWKLYVFGVLTHVIMLLCMLILPWDLAMNTYKNIGLPVLVLYPMASLLLSALIQTQVENADMVSKLSESESLYRSFFDLNQAMMLILDPKTGNIIDANKASENYYGWDKKTLTSMKVSQINTMSPDEIEEKLKLAVEEKQNHFEFKHRLANGELRDVEVYSGPVMRLGKHMIYSIIHDVTDRIIAQSDFANSEIQFKTLVDNAPYAIFIQLDNRFYYLNKMACNLFGIKTAEALLDEPVMEHFHPDSREVIKERIRLLNEDKKMVPANDEVFLKMDGTPVDVTVLAIPYRTLNKNGAIVFALDITEAKALQLQKQEFEIQMRQQQKLEAIGSLAGGVAHEINNPINGIMNYAQLIVDSLGQVKETESYAKEIIRETERISEIVRNLLQFARMEKQSHSYASLYDIVNRTVSLTNVIFKKDNIVLDIQLDPELPDFKCRSQQIQQVLMNLLTNLRDALNDRYPQSDPLKKIEIRAHLTHENDRKWIELSVKDYGTGIDEEIIQKIFEPFYSTKAKDKGTGLGLSISYGIVKDHHGEIIVDSIKGEYSMFRVILTVDNGWETMEATHD